MCDFAKINLALVYSIYYIIRVHPAQLFMIFFQGRHVIELWLLAAHVIKPDNTNVAGLTFDLSVKPSFMP